LRLTIDDSKDNTGCHLKGALLEGSGSETALEPLPVTIKSRDESPGLTRIVVNLGATNLTPSAIRNRNAGAIIYACDHRGGFRPSPGMTSRNNRFAAGVVYRVDLNGRNEARLDIPLDTQIQSSELLLLVSQRR